VPFAWDQGGADSVGRDTMEGINPVYLAWSLLVQHDSILAKVSTVSQGTKRLETDVLLSVPITVPSLTAQRKFERVVEKFRFMHEKNLTSRVQNENLFSRLSHALFAEGAN